MIIPYYMFPVPCSLEDCREWGVGHYDGKWVCQKHKEKRKKERARIVDVPEAVARRLIR